ncbi:hypothetical protein [Thiocystis violascens]|uniref:Uncharacterized protein n=1 Tax=Thiocystis violascens (strain ATCC 17096 / DSM 198 / 6111) TaxID=765911 RepID=I3YFL8_THIV6|nr:hypothetical protein [Thiocystis violascens]AFL75786.1 hypothetical protein Thivi_3951 [Thiocystis violascens DSM 198]
MPVEGYARHGASLLARFEPAAQWRIEGSLGWARNLYDQAPQQRKRDDRKGSGGLALYRMIGRHEWFCRLDWLDSDSTAPGQSFRQEVTACGLAWSF